MKTELGLALPTPATPLGAYRVLRCRKFAFSQWHALIVDTIFEIGSMP
jgi:hypothetical protein